MLRDAGVVLMDRTARDIRSSSIRVRSTAPVADGENNRPLNAVTFNSPATQPSCASREIAFTALHTPRTRVPVNRVETIESIV